MAASGRAVSRSNLRAPKGSRVKAVRQPRIPDPLKLPEVQSAVERLRDKYRPNRRTPQQEGLSESLQVSRDQSRAERKLENTTLRSMPTRGEALKAERQVRDTTQLNAEGTRVERLAGATQVGNEGLGAVQRAAERGKLRREGKQFTTPKVRRTQRKVKRARRQLRKAKAAVASGGMPANVPPEYAKWIRKFSPRIDKQAREVYGMSGNEFMAKMLQGESGFDMSKVGPNTPYGNARGAAQFIPPTRDAFVEKFGIDPWRSTKEAVQAMALHLDGKSFSKTFGIQGYNPGINDSYYLNQDVGPTVKANPRAKRRLERAEARAEGVAKEASDLGLDAQSLVTPKVARQLGIKPPEESGAPPKAVKAFKGMIAAAKQLEAWQLPYVWGGGHGTSKVGDPRQYGGLDCSSTVSHILQQGGVNIPTIVSGSFGEYTKPGPGAVTILYNPGHVLMKIGNKYFGTSGTNPSGGPGWLDKSLGDSEMASGKYAIGHIPGLGPKIAKQMNLDPDSYRNFPGMSVSGNTATANTGTVSYTPTFSDSPIVAGDGPTSREQRRKAVLGQLRDLGYSVTSEGIRRTGLAAGSTVEAPESVSTVKRRYGIK